MANIGAFDAELRALAWFDAIEVATGWFDYGMPFDHPLIDTGVEVYIPVGPPTIQIHQY